MFRQKIHPLITRQKKRSTAGGTELQEKTNVANTLLLGNRKQADLSFTNM
jgi:hypothetical protein